MVLVVTESLTFDGFFPYKSPLSHKEYRCIHLAGGKLRHRDYPSEPQKQLGDELFLLSEGVKHCSGFVDLCTNDLLKVTCGILTSALWTAPSFLRSMISRLNRIPTARSFLSKDYLQVVPLPFFWPSVPGQMFKDIVCIVDSSRVQDCCT